MAHPIDRLARSLADRYRIERELGQGGMAVVYLAHDVRHDRKVAVKVLHAELAAALGVGRFVAEIKVTANLQHPNILPLLYSGLLGQAADEGRQTGDAASGSRRLAVAVGIIHRVATTGGGGGGGGAARGGGAAAGRGAPAGEACGEQATIPVVGGTPGLTHDSQTEGYVILSGSGTLVPAVIL